MKTNLLLKAVESVIFSIESTYGKSAILPECPLQALYLEARKQRYNLKNAPEVYAKNKLN